MKHLFFAFITLLTLFACGSEPKEPAKPAAPAKPDLSANPDYQKGLDLIGKNDCLTCHKIEEKLVGPSYRDVAAKYAGQSGAIAILAEKIMKGGTGVWGEIPMAPHPNLSKEDAESLAKYVLLFNN